MVCLRESLPLIQLGTHDIAGYSRRWLAEAIAEASPRVAGFSEDLAEAVLFYLREVHEDNTITISQMEDHLRSALGGVGFHETRKIHLAPPPQHIALTEFAYRAGPGFELAFFTQLAERLKLVREAGVEELLCSGLSDCVSILLRGSAGKQLRQRGGDLAEELVHFIRTGLHSEDAPPIRLSIV